MSHALLRLAAALAVGAVCLPAAAETCIVGATVHPITAPAAPMTVCFDADGVTRVLDAGADTGAAERFDADGMVLTPGLIDVDTQLGLVEIWAVEETRDTGGAGDSVRAAFRAADNVNPQSTLFAVARSGGVTSVISAPGGGLVSGQAAWLDLRGERVEDLVIDDAIAMVMNIGSGAGDAEAGDGDGSRGLALLRYRELFDDARLFADDPDAYDAAQMRALTASRLDLQAMLPVVAGDLPVLMHASSQQDMRAALALGAEQGFDMAFVGAQDAWAIADELAAADVIVVVHPVDNLPDQFSRLGSREDNAALLNAAGVRVAISGGDTHNVRLLRQMAGNAVRAGMAWDAALEAVTLVPAQLAGLGDRYGAIEPGRASNLVLWSGDPFELSTAVEAMWIGGEPVALRSRQDALYERYR